MAGCILAYKIGRHIIRRSEKKWTTSDRAVMLCYSSLSFVGIVLAAIGYVVSVSVKEKDAEW